MRYAFVICDVFTDQPFGGNQLAVLPEAEGLSDAAMQMIAREFNFPESTFVLPASDPANTAQVRIFTPAAEVPFAGHPNIGTAVVLADGQACALAFEEKAGLVRVTVSDSLAGLRAELVAPRKLDLGEHASVPALAAALGLDTSEISTRVHPPQIASCGMAFLIVEAEDLEAVSRAQISPADLSAICRNVDAEGVLLYTRFGEERELDVHMRMFAPLHGIPEDPATGSAAVALAGLRAAYKKPAEGSFTFTMAQGVEMGRPSRLIATAVKRNGRVVETRVAGDAVIVARGEIEVPEALLI
ncbi:MAG: PhzF family phenazine biosynthesis protein [Geminicoccaceae bacterium]